MLFTQAANNFASNMEFLKSDWTCEQCGEGTDTPRYLSVVPSLTESPLTGTGLAIDPT